MTVSHVKNPFRQWAESTRRMRDRFINELSGVTPQAAALIGNMTALVNSFDRLETRLRQIERQDPQAFDALLRAMEPK